jgi:L-ascorbate metabolism protein UlaG (beta-lactamase superfamily)
MKHLMLVLTALWYLPVYPQPDILGTEKGDVTMTPVLHATVVLEWDGKTIYLDPYGGAERFQKFAPADLICITHLHGDHLNKETLSALDLSSTTLIAPQSVIDALGEIKFGRIQMLANGDVIDLLDLKVEAVPMYNLPNDETARHPKGWGNGYVLTIGGKKFYFAGDTEDIPEMRSLSGIDYAFICMNVPFTMDVEQAADAVLEFKPKVVYPYHFRGQNGFSDVNKFKSIVNGKDQAIQVRLRNWYPE